MNRDLAALRRAFNLALRASKLQKVPCFPHLKKSAPRSGFVEEAAYDKLVKNATSDCGRCSPRPIRSASERANCWASAFDRLTC
jgi:hypothetical protein